MAMPEFLLIDNDDSFTINLWHLLARESNAQINLLNYRQMGSVALGDYDLIIISPGPGHPRDYPGYQKLKDIKIPILGICLGMQIMNDLYGGETGRLNECIHGKAESIEFDGKKFNVARYHSLGIIKPSEDFEIIAFNKSGFPMAIKHKTRPIIGYQFHPESFLTDKEGYFINYAIKSLFKV
jgi:para-aminobenzoate synthetase component 2